MIFCRSSSYLALVRHADRDTECDIGRERHREVYRHTYDLRDKQTDAALEYVYIYS